MAIESMSGEGKTIAPTKEFAENAHVKSMEQYEQMYKRSIEDPEGFWADVAREMHWFKEWDTVYKWDLSKHEVRWFDGGQTKRTQPSAPPSMRSATSISCVARGRRLCCGAPYHGQVVAKTFSSSSHA